MSEIGEIEEFVDQAGKDDKYAFEKSEFMPPDSSSGKLAKALLDEWMIPDSFIHFRLTHGGQVSGTPKKKEKSVRTGKSSTQSPISYCSDFSTIMNGIIGLLSFEVARNIMYRRLLFAFIRKILADMESTRDYESLIMYSKEILSIVTSTRANTVITTSESNKYSFDRRMGTSIETPEMAVMSVIEKFTIGKDNGTISSFEQDRSEGIERIIQSIDKIGNIRVTIQCVDDLCFNVGRYAIGYNKNFIKMFEIVLKAALIDCKDADPFAEYINKVISMKDANVYTYVERYMGMFREVVSKANLALGSDPTIEKDISKVDIVCNSTLFSELGTIAVMTIVKICRCLSFNRKSAMIAVGSTTRIQLYQIFNAILNIFPSVDIDLDTIDIYALFHSLTTIKQLQSRKSKKDDKTTEEK